MQTKTKATQHVSTKSREDNERKWKDAEKYYKKRRVVFYEIKRCRKIKWNRRQKRTERRLKVKKRV